MLGWTTIYCWCASQTTASIVKRGGHEQKSRGKSRAGQTGAALLFVGAQTGFLDRPRVLGNMALDSWMPHRFSQLSDRLVTKNGVFLMGLAAIAALLYTRRNITTPVVIYSINVFLTF